MTKEKEIQHLMTALKISKEEAEEVYRFDHDESISTPEIDKMTAAAAKIKRYEKSDKPRKTAAKERKVDEKKKRLLMDCKTLLEGLGAEVTALKTETEITFQFESEEYTLKLIKHRPKK